MIVKDAVRELALHSAASVQRAMEILDRTARGVVLAVDDEFHLLHTITDGDIRRGLLAGLTLHSPISEVIARKSVSEYAVPTTVRLGVPREEILRLMEERCLRHIPVVDADGHVVDLVTADQLVPNEVIAQAVVMAGGFGSRLMPLTDEMPKPMLHVGDKPILEHIVGQLQQAGIRRVSFTTHYRPEAIEAHFGGGENFGLEIAYVNEDQPLGTAGALSMLAPCEEPMLVMNGDILTRVDFRAMLAFHREHGADLTVGVRQYDLSVPYGVVRCEGASVRAIEEKPVVNFLVNAGIYLIEPAAHRRIPSAQRFDMTDLIAKLTAEGRSVAAFPIVEYWLDIGRHDDYAQAQQDFKSWEASR